MFFYKRHLVLRIHSHTALIFQDRLIQHTCFLFLDPLLLYDQEMQLAELLLWYQILARFLFRKFSSNYLQCLYHYPDYSRSTHRKLLLNRVDNLPVYFLQVLVHSMTSPQKSPR